MDTSQERLVNDGESEAPLLARDDDDDERDETYRVTQSSRSGRISYL